MFVYILQSLKDYRRRYIGITDDMEVRLKQHNAGKTLATRENRPWKYRAYFWFEDASSAEAFERYLKSGSGRAFTKRHFR